MLEIGPKHDMEYRKEVLGPLFSHIQSAESCYVVGGPSAGKTRLLDHLMRRDVQKYYLGEKAEQTWLVRVDMNRLPSNEQEWAFYELILSSFLLGSDDREIVGQAREEIIEMEKEVIKSKDFVQALRYFELAVNLISFGYGLRPCFLFDEFDETYQSMSRQIFAQLRAVRDGNKNRMSYVILMRNLPEILRPEIDNEGFYELVSRNMIGLGPYTSADALNMLQQLEVRRAHPLNVEQRTALVESSGGQAGYLQALMNLFILDPSATAQMNSSGWLTWCSQQDAIREESRKIWQGISPNEQEGLRAFAQGRYGDIPMPTINLLLAKGMLRKAGDEICFFSPLFERFATNQG